MKESLGAKTILYPTPVLLVGTYDDRGRPNIMTCSWAGICCSQPPAIAVSLREATYTYGSILRKACFTISIPAAAQVALADYAGTHSGRNTDKFAALGVTAERAEHVDAPYVRECPLVIECRLIHSVLLGLHTLFVGEVLDVKAEQSILTDDGGVDIGALQPFCFDPSMDGYHVVGEKIGGAFSIE